LFTDNPSSRLLYGDATISRAFLMLTLVLAGEIVFGLPFHTARFYRPTLLEAFDFTNTRLGEVFAVYGVMAMIAYFPGGALADRLAARSLLTLSLVATGRRRPPGLLPVPRCRRLAADAAAPHLRNSD
jgi:MFS family permease